MNRKKLTWGQVTILGLAAVPMVAAGVAGGIASYFNFAGILNSASNALSLVIAGEGATFICAVVALAVTLMGQHTPAVVRLGLWVLPGVASVAGGIIAPDVNTKVVMALAPLGMTAAGEGLTLVARRIVAYRSNVDLEAQRRAGLLVWHAGRAQNGGWLARRLSKAAVWRLTKQFASSDGQMAIQVDDIQRYRIGENLDVNLLAALTTPTKATERPSLPVAPAAPAIAPAQPSEAVNGPSVASLDNAVPAAKLDDEISKGDDNGDWIQQLLAEQSARDAEAKAATLVKLLSSDDVAVQLNVKPGTVRSWVHRGKLRVHDRDANGRALFHPDDVARLP
ncbi:hypothetical protein SEA_XKCD426_76 [Streptomyces phage Xkcd426]|nr:hypothetical protein SEA_XKCD426_76 [Streptomyces phage Xkcd426]